MKRTRHIEIISYSRRVTVTHGSGVTVEPASELSAIEVLINVREAVASTLEELNEGQLIATESAAVQMSRPSLLHNLRYWLRRCF